MSLPHAVSPVQQPQPVVIVLVDDAAHLQTAWAAMPAPAANTHWVMVACAPRMAQRPSKWGSHRVREHWRARWSAKLFEEVGAWLHLRGHAFTPVVAEGPLPEFTDALKRTHGAEAVLDLRRPKGEVFGAVVPPLATLPPPSRAWSLVTGVLSVGLLLGGIAE
jgi:hypothetical protein